jgi:hypothetical protein
MIEQWPDPVLLPIIQRVLNKKIDSAVEIKKGS